MPQLIILPMVSCYITNQITGEFQILCTRTSWHSLDRTSLAQRYSNLEIVQSIPRKWLGGLDSFFKCYRQVNFWREKKKKFFSSGVSLETFNLLLDFIFPDKIAFHMLTQLAR